MPTDADTTKVHRIRVDLGRCPPGYSPTATPGADTRFAVGVEVNGAIVAIGGGQLSASDTPLPSFAHAIHLDTGDKVSVAAYTTIDVAIGSSGLDVNSSYYFQGEYLGQ